MSIDKRTAFLSGYSEMLMFIPFLSSFFTTRPRDIVNAESVKIDIKRGTRKIAPAISSISAIGGKIKKSVYTQKEFTPPVIALSGDFAPGDLTNKAFSMTEYQTADMDYQIQLQTNIADTMMEIDQQVMRNPEYQASQILQTGGMTLYDDKGEPAFTISFNPKATHFPTVTTAWSDPAADRDADLLALYEEIKKDSGANARNIVFGRTALSNYLQGEAVEKKFDITRILKK